MVVVLTFINIYKLFCFIVAIIIRRLDNVMILIIVAEPAFDMNAGTSGNLTGILSVSLHINHFINLFPLYFFKISPCTATGGEFLDHFILNVISLSFSTIIHGPFRFNTGSISLLIWPY